VSRRRRRDADPREFLGREFFLLLSANFLGQISVGATVLLPAFLAALGADRRDVGWLVGLGQGSGAVVGLLAGVASDRHGRRPVVIAGCLLSAVGLALSAVLQRADGLALVQQLLVAAGAACILNGYYVWATDIIPAARRTEGLCYFSASSLLPLALGYLPFELGRSGLALRWFFVAAAALITASALLALVVLREHRARGPGEALRWRDLRAVIASPRLRSVWLLTFGFGGVLELFAAFATLTLAAQVRGNPGVFWLLYSITAVVLRLAGARLPGRLGEHRTILLAWLSAALAAGAIAVADRPAWAAVAGVFAGIAHGYGYPALISLLVGRVPARLRGTGVAALDALWFVVALVLAPAMGALADRAGRDAIIFELGGAGSLVIAVAWIACERRSERRAGATPR
jgi:MFS family permease